MHTFTEEHTPAHVVKVFPKASDLFKVHGINFCCKGDIVLKTTFEEKSLEGTDILERLNRSYADWKEKGNEAIDWQAMSVEAIVKYITTHYHTFLQDELSALGEFVKRINHVHGHDSPHLKDLYELYNEFLIEVEMHLIEESTEFMPMILVDLSTNLEAVKTEVGKLKERNAKMIQLLKEMRTVTNDFEPPIDACGSYRVAYARLAELETEMMDYIHIENNVLFEKLTA